MMLTTGYKGGFIHFNDGRSAGTNTGETVRAQYGQNVKYVKSEHAAKVWITKQKREQAEYWNTPYQLREQDFYNELNQLAETNQDNIK